MTSFLMLASLMLGLLAWCIPIITLVKFKGKETRNRAFFLYLSVSACAVSLFFQISYTNRMIKLQDWSALMDTARMQYIASAVLLIGTVILNAVNLSVYGYKRVHQ